MTRTRSAFTQNDIQRAITAARKAGLEVERIEIWKDGRIVLGKELAAPSPETELDKWLETQGAG